MPQIKAKPNLEALKVSIKCLLKYLLLLYNAIFNQIFVYRKITFINQLNMDRDSVQMTQALYRSGQSLRCFKIDR